MHIANLGTAFVEQETKQVAKGVGLNTIYLLAVPKPSYTLPPSLVNFLKSIFKGFVPIAFTGIPYHTTNVNTLQKSAVGKCTFCRICRF